ANEIDLDVIVVDHHAIPPRLPDAVALIDPKLDGCDYPCTELAACGIAYKLLLALAVRLGRDHDPHAQLDLVALGTVCDMAPLLVAELPGDAPLLLVGHPAISQGIVGLVAGRLADQFGRPAFVYEEGAELSRGSARGSPYFNVVEALQAAAHLLVRFGGHRQ